MNALQFFSNPDLAFPLRRKSTDFIEFLESTFEHYNKIIKELKPEDSITDGIKKNEFLINKISFKILDLIRFNLTGAHWKSFNIIKELFDESMCFALFLLKKTEVYDDRRLFRMRCSSGLEIFENKKELFHIPFELRHLVSRQRYSLPGLPCLYLGSNLYICWEELNRPPFDKIYLAEYSIASNKRLIFFDLSTTPQDIARHQDGFTKDIKISTGVLWPLLAACSVKRLNHNAPFIAEYIVPQLVLHYLISGDIECDGIAYSPVSVNSIEIEKPIKNINFVFPAKHLESRGHCPILISKFNLTDPVFWPLIEHNPVSDDPLLHDQSKPQQIGLIKSNPIFYDISTFGKVERKLSRIKRDILN